MKRFARSRLAALSRSTPPFRGKMRVTRALERLLGAGAHPVSTKSMGAGFLVQGMDLIEFSILWHGAYGRRVLQCLQHEITHQKKTCLWDVGANIGAVSLPLALNNPQLSVHSFEPSPRVLAKLMANVQLNGDLDNIALYSFALSSADEVLPFYESSLEANSGVGGMMPLDNRARTATFIQALLGDDVIDRGVAPKPDIIKIDVEGWEPNVLAGLTKLLESDAPLSVLWEHVPFYLRNREHPLNKLTQLLQESGFDLFSCREGGHFDPWHPDMLESDHDFFARRG